MTIASLDDPQSRLYEAYASQHAGCCGDEAVALVYRRDSRPLLPTPAAALARSSLSVAHGLANAARVMVWQVVNACHRIALAAETGMLLRGRIVTKNLITARKTAVAVKPEEG